MEHEDDEDDGSWFINHYRHDDCPKAPGVRWVSPWSCKCNDRCPECNREIEPYFSEEVEQDRCGRLHAVLGGQGDKSVP